MKFKLTEKPIKNSVEHLKS